MRLHYELEHLEVVMQDKHVENCVAIRVLFGRVSVLGKQQSHALFLVEACRKAERVLGKVRNAMVV